MKRHPLAPKYSNPKQRSPGASPACTKTVPRKGPPNGSKKSAASIRKYAMK